MWPPLPEFLRGLFEDREFADLSQRAAERWQALVVDDVGYSRLIAREVREQLDFKVVQALSGAGAWHLLDEDLDIGLVASGLMHE